MTKEISYHHIRNPDHPEKGGATFAMELNVDGNVCGYAIAKCNPKDNFCKHTGRIKAAGRLNSVNYWFPVNPALSIRDFIEQEEKTFTQNGDVI